uniref:Ion transport domain-containing protein n=1 Tax=Guillardia theta TaxID=55529 RepID=A0A7S4L2Q6_GUITH|mmetsp:Transcript_36304/g.113262  ORF Transcript_36304/g.113262 Transcript_36304/m.113262 type:complete len:1019 (+) Transcript_36304:128-3184(+)
MEVGDHREIGEQHEGAERRVDNNGSNDNKDQYYIEVFAPAAKLIGESAKPKQNDGVRGNNDRKQETLTSIITSRRLSDVSSIRSLHTKLQVETDLWKFFSDLSKAKELSSVQLDDWVETNLTSLKQRINDHTTFGIPIGPMGDSVVHIAFLLAYTSEDNVRSMLRLATKLLEANWFSEKQVLLGYESEFQRWQKDGKFAATRGLYTGETILHICIANEDKETVEWLLERYATAPPKRTSKPSNEVAQSEGKEAKGEDGEAKGQGEEAKGQVKSSRTQACFGGVCGMVKWILYPKPSSDHNKSKVTESDLILHRRAIGDFFLPSLIKTDVDVSRLGLLRAYLTDEPIGTDRKPVALSKLEDNKDSSTGSHKYWGQYPLSFAASTGNEDVCKAILDFVYSQLVSHKESKCDCLQTLDGWQGICLMLKHVLAPEWLNEAQINAQDLKSILHAADEFGNTALHIATLHGHHEVISCLIEAEKRIDNILRDMTGGDGSKTSRSSMGEAEEEAEEEAETLLTMLNKDGYTPLTLAARHGDVDTFYFILERYMKTILWAFGSKQRTQVSLDQIDSFRREKKEVKNEKEKEEEQEQKEQTTSKAALSLRWWWPAAAEKTRMHSHPKWRSALEVIVEHEVEEFVNDPFINRLIETKWKRFGRRIYLIDTALPFSLFLVAFVALLVLKVKQWDQKQQGPELHSLHSWTLALNVLVKALGVWLLFFGWTHRHLKQTDRNPSERYKRMDFKKLLQKNISSILSILTAVLVFCIPIHAPTDTAADVLLLAMSTVLVFSLLLHLLLPIKRVGTIMIMIYDILLQDVSLYCVIYGVTLTGFSLALYTMLQTADVQKLYEDNNSTRFFNYLTTPGASFLQLTWNSLGDDYVFSTQLLLASVNPTLSFMLLISWSILSELLLLNLIIAMMNRSYEIDSHDVHRIWFFPFADLVLRHERRMFIKSWRLSRFFMGDVSLCRTGSSFKTSNKFLEPEERLSATYYDIRTEDVKGERKGWEEAMRTKRQIIQKLKNLGL